MAVLAPTLLKPVRLDSYAKLMDALRYGHVVRAVIQYAKCKLIIDGKEEKAPDATGGMEFKAWEQFAKGVVRNKLEYVSVSESVLIAHPSYGYVMNYVKLRLYEDNSVEIIARYLKPTNQEVVMDEKFMAKISNGKDSEAVALFAEK